MDAKLLVSALTKYAMGLLIVAFLLFVPAGTLEWWRGWPSLPSWVSVAGAVVFLASYDLYAEVKRENAYLSRVVSGLYGMVRHPMYSASLVLFPSMPVVLGLPFSCFVMLAYVPIIVKRIGNEEKVLSDGLDGYVEYMGRVRWG